MNEIIYKIFFENKTKSMKSKMQNKIRVCTYT